MNFFCWADGDLPLQVPGDGGAQEAEGVHDRDGGVCDGEEAPQCYDIHEVHPYLLCFLGVTFQLVVVTLGHNPVYHPHLNPL